MQIKKCKKCGGSCIKKDRRMRGKQRYKCQLCGYVFQNTHKTLNTEKLWKEYSSGKQTYGEIEAKYNLSKVTVQKYLDTKSIFKIKITAQKTVLLIDTTYFGRKYGIMVFRSYELKKNLYWKEVKRETKQEYIYIWNKTFRKRMTRNYRCSMRWKKRIIVMNGLNTNTNVSFSSATSNEKISYPKSKIRGK